MLIPNDKLWESDRIWSRHILRKQVWLGMV
jgi:hypothetical protein